VLKGNYGDLSQQKRMSVFKLLNRLKIDILRAMTLAARGLIFQEVLTHVYTMNIPQVQEAIVHRNRALLVVAGNERRFLFLSITPNENGLFYVSLKSLNRKKNDTSTVSTQMLKLLKRQSKIYGKSKFYH